MTSARRTTLRQLWLAPLLCFGAAWALSLTPVVQQLEWKTLDWRTAYRVFFQGPPDPRIAVVLYGDETDSAAPALQWPPDRSVHAEIITKIAVGKPKVITYDVIVDAMREGDGDAKMAQAVQRVGRFGVKVVTAGVTSGEPGEPAPGLEGPTQPITDVQGDIGQLIGEKDAIRPFPRLRAVSLYGFADTPHGADGVQREIPLVVRVNDRVYPSLALQTLLSFLDVPVEKVRVRLGDAVYLPTKDKTWRIPAAPNGRLLLNYRYDRDALGDDFATYSVLEVLVKTNDYYVEKKPNAPKPPAFDGRIVLLGQFVTGKADAGATPRGGMSPLVLVHANLLNNVLRGDFARRMPDWLIWGAALAFGYAGVLLVADRSIIVLCGGAVLGIVTYTALCIAMWIWKSWWFPVTAPLLGFVALQFVVIGRRVVQEQRAKQEIKNMFGSYVSPVLVDRMISAGQPPQLGGAEVDLTAYFSDIQGFSSFSEKLAPEPLVELMNEYLTACTDIVQEEMGTLDKFIGDAVVAMFGAPIEMPDHAYRACIASQRVQLRLGELRAKWAGEGDKWPAIVKAMRTRIGLNTGRCVVGNMGSRTRFNYTMMGDDVNLAARMESGAKSWGVYTMCTEATRLACGQHDVDARVVFRPLGRIVVKGRSQPVPIFEVTGLKENLAASTYECIEIFSRGLDRYYLRDWDGALELFGRSAELEPEAPGRGPGTRTNPSRIYLELVMEHRAAPPPAAWDGVYHMKDK